MKEKRASKRIYEYWVKQGREDAIVGQEYEYKYVPKYSREAYSQGINEIKIEQMLTGTGDIQDD